MPYLQAIRFQLVIARLRFDPRIVYVEFVVDEVALGRSKFFSGHFGFPLPFITEAVLHAHLSLGAHLRPKYRVTRPRSTPRIDDQRKVVLDTAKMW
jgi:hypothetical protein